MDNVTTRHMPFRSVGKSDGRTLRGLAVPFNSPTRIDNWMEGTFDEQFSRGAFKRSLGMRTPKLQFDHGTHPLFGSLPIGEFRELRETDEGLDVEAQVFAADLFAPLREALASEAIDGMSIRFRPIRVEVTDADARDDGGTVELRTVTEAELIELGPVVFPAYADTRVDVRHLGTLDLGNEIDRHRLAQALLGGVSLAGLGADRNSNGPGTDPEAGSPVVTSSGPASSHPDAPTPRRHRRRAALARLAQYESE